MIRLLTWGPRNGLQTPNARRASAKPRRASIIVAGVGPRNGPHPQRSSRLGEAAARLDHRRRCGAPQWPLHLTGGPEMAPTPPTLVAPRETRGAPRCPAALLALRGNSWRASMSPQRSLWPGGAGPRLGVASSRRTARSIARLGRPAV